MKNGDVRQASHGSRRRAFQRDEFQTWSLCRSCQSLLQQGVFDGPKIVNDISIEIETLETYCFLYEAT